MSPDDVIALPRWLQERLDPFAARWAADRTLPRLWQGDPSVWTGADEGEWLGWLGLTEDVAARVEELARLAPAALGERFDQVLVLGMGGSSLGPEVLGTCLPPVGGAPRLLVLDSTDPDQIRGVESAVSLDRTLFIVSSKSGTTVETTSLMDYFYDRVRQQQGQETAGSCFVAVTDPGSTLEEVAAERGFREVFLGRRDVGGRFSVLSGFGLVPAAAAGFDVERLLTRAHEMAVACGGSVPVRDNPGAMLGLALGVLAGEGRDKLSLVLSPALGSLGAWIEQLVAESTGKRGLGVVPVDGEPLRGGARTGEDRVYVSVSLAQDDGSNEMAALDALEREGHPVIRLRSRDAYDLGAEFFRWELATAVCGAVLGLNPFDQPDVEASKRVTRGLVEATDSDGPASASRAVCVDGGLEIHADAANASALGLSEASDALAALRALLSRIEAGDYFAVLAYVDMSPANEEALRRIQDVVGKRSGVATTVGFGPRYLHSTGQLHKGGPNRGVFLQITRAVARDVPVPGGRPTFGTLQAAQAAGDLSVLNSRGRRALRLHITGEVSSGLRRVVELVERATR